MLRRVVRVAHYVIKTYIPDIINKNNTTTVVVARYSSNDAYVALLR